jgi:hypothetical protein
MTKIVSNSNAAEIHRGGKRLLLNSRICFVGSCGTNSDSPPADS